MEVVGSKAWGACCAYHGRPAASPAWTCGQASSETQTHSHWEKASEITVPSDRVPQSHICVVLEHPQGQRSTHCSLGTAVGGGTLPKVSSLSYGRVSAVGFFSVWQL